MKDGLFLVHSDFEILVIKTFVKIWHKNKRNSLLFWNPRTIKYQQDPIFQTS